MRAHELDEELSQLRAQLMRCRQAVDTAAQRDSLQFAVRKAMMWLNDWEKWRARLAEERMSG